MPFSFATSTYFPAAPTSPRSPPPDDDDTLLARIAELEAQVAVRDQQVRDLNEYVVEIKEDLSSQRATRVAALESDLDAAAKLAVKWHEWSSGVIPPEDITATGATACQLLNLAVVGKEDKDKVLLPNAFEKQHIAEDWTDAKWGSFIDYCDTLSANGVFNDEVEECKGYFEDQYVEDVP